MFRHLFVLLILSLISISCSKKIYQKEGKPSILTSIPPHAFFAEQIAGNTLNIHTLLPPGTDLHTYEPSPRLIERQAHARVWFRIGEPMEEPIVHTFQEQRPQMKMVDLQEQLPLISCDGAIALPPCTGHCHDRDLHTWLSPKLALKQAERIAQELIALFPEHAQEYRMNYEQLARDLMQLEEDMRQELTPFRGEALLVSHPAFNYFCRDFSLIQLPVECAGKQPRPKDVQRLVKQTEDHVVRCAFLIRGFDNRGAQLIGHNLQLPTYHVDPYARDYLSNMRALSGKIAQ